MTTTRSTEDYINENELSDGHRERAWTGVKAYSTREA
jgi:hypothetical protein